MTEISEAKSYSEIGKANWVSEDSIKSTLVDPESHNVKSYEIYANLIRSNLNLHELFHNNEKYVNYIADGYKPVYWVTGYKEGGAIANILAAKLRDEGKSVYAYTFGSPMTIYNNPDEPGYTKTGYSARYDCIFNVVNEDDAYAYMMPQELGFSRYGKTCFGGYGVYNPTTNQFEKDPESVNQIIKALTSLYKDKKGKMKDKVREETYKSNRTYLNLQNVLSRLITAIDINRNHKEAMATGNNDTQNKIDTIEEFYERYRDVSNLSTFINAIETNFNKIKRAGQEDVYFEIAHNMQNADIVNVVNLHDNNRKNKLRVATSSEIKNTLDELGKWYVDNVYTYRIGKYGAAKDKNGNVIYKKQGKKNYVSYIDNDDDYQKSFKTEFEQRLKDSSNKAIASRSEIILAKATKIMNEMMKNGQTDFSQVVQPSYIYTTGYNVDSYIDYEIPSIYGRKEATNYNSKERARYSCNLVYNEYVEDDCSAFAEAVLIKFIKDMGIKNCENLKYVSTNSKSFATNEGWEDTKARFEQYGFKCYRQGIGGDYDLSNLSDQSLEYGDLLCANGHVEFYRDEDHTFGFGSTKKSYEDNTGFDFVWSDLHKCFTPRSQKDNSKIATKNKYVSVYRYEGK